MTQITFLAIKQLCFEIFLTFDNLQPWNEIYFGTLPFAIYR